jgi:ribosomal protein S18 acetylase RimI-like enzyme
MSVAELASRMLRWLEADYRAVLFEVSAEPVAYLLYRPSEDGIYLRQLFVCRGHRRRGYGRLALDLFRDRILSSGTVISLEVLVNNDVALSFWRAVGFRDHAISLRANSR